MNNLQLQELQEEKPQGFMVNNLESANWCFRKIQALQNRIQENKALADSERQRIDSWEEKELHQDMESINYLSSLVKQYYVEQKEKDKKFKLSTPYGKVVSRKTSKWSYDDEKVKSWLKENGHAELLKVKEELDKANIKIVFKDGIDHNTGECVEGVTIEKIENISIKVE